MKSVKRPSHGKLKLANSCWRTSKSLQTRAFTRQIRVKSQQPLVCNMADIVQWHPRRVAAYVLVLLYVNRRRRNRKGWKNRKVSTKPSRIPTLEAYDALVSLYAADETSYRSSINMKSCLTVFTSVHYLVKCHEHHVNRARVLIGWQLPTHVYQSFKYEFTKSKKLLKKSRREYRQVLFVTNSLHTCLPTVLVPFTNTNFSFPTRISQL